MALKNETIIDVLATLPWWVSVLVAGFAFCTLQYILPSSYDQGTLEGGERI